jgi:hypothetical protein
MSDKKYNGWTNYETWNAMLWINNVDGVYDGIVDALEQQIEQFVDEGTWDEDGYLQYAEQFIRDYFVDTFICKGDDPGKWNDENYGPVSDAISTYMSEANWREIAEAVWHDNKQEWRSNRE